MTKDVGEDSLKISYKHRKTAHMGILPFIVPSRDVHSLFWVPMVLRWHGVGR